jgi:cytochrome c biogenesis protein CcdA
LPERDRIQLLISALWSAVKNWQKKKIAPTKCQRKNILGFLLIAFLAGAAALLNPCVSNDSDDRFLFPSQ